MCGSRFKLKFYRFALLRKRLKTDFKTDFTLKMLTLEVLVERYLGCFVCLSVEKLSNSSHLKKITYEFKPENRPFPKIAKTCHEE